MKFSEIHDSKGLCKDITGLGRWGNGDVEVFFEHTSEIDDVMELIEQSYRKQAEE
jgi:predicted transport protein